ncbi:MAG: hypothetical protein CME32_17860 [Gimesia sp.]|nr:hypothetical protein [Gimesia sp.]
MTGASPFKPGTTATDKTVSNSTNRTLKFTEWLLWALLYPGVTINGRTVRLDRDRSTGKAGNQLTLVLNEPAGARGDFGGCCFFHKAVLMIAENPETSIVSPAIGRFFC